MSMSRKDYVAAAEVIAYEMRNISDMTSVRKTAAEQTLRSVANGLANMFAMDNGRFNRHTFALACGLGDPVPVKYVKTGDTYYYYGRKVKVVAVSGPLVNVHYLTGWNSGKDNMFTASVKEMQR